MLMNKQRPEGRVTATSVFLLVLPSEVHPRDPIPMTQRITWGHQEGRTDASVTADADAGN